MTDRTIHLHRVLRASPQKIYRAFTEADALAKWLPPHGFTCQVQHLEARIEAFEKPTARKQHDQHRPGSQRKGRNGS